MKKEIKPHVGYAIQVSINHILIDMLNMERTLLEHPVRSKKKVNI